MAATKAPDSTTPSPIESNVTFRMVDLCRLTERYMPEEDSKKVYRAFMLAAEAHDGVVRKSGEPYVTHPLEVAGILADLHLDADSICAALLHDVIEDTDFSYDDIADQFGATVADLVEGVTKLSTSGFKNKHEASIASFQKMIQAMTKDYRVVLIKLADRLHNVSTLGAMRPDKQRRIAKETLEIHAPLARRMGMNALRHKLQMRAFRSLYPYRSQIIEKWWDSCLTQKEETYSAVLANIQNALENEGITSSTVFHREKNLYRLYEKEKRRRVPITFNRSDISYDIRILTKNSSDCYRALGVVHQLYVPKVGELKDFISVPKVYGFQALQTSVVTKNQDLIQVQIQSREMHQVAQFGIAAQWRFPYLNEQHRVDMAQRRLSTWLAQVKEIQEATENPEDFLEDMKADFFLREVYVMTPGGDSKILRTGATPVDFAYAIHTDIGQHCVAARIDGRKVPLNTQLHDGATVEIITKETSSPHPSWLNFVVTGKARAAIRHWI
ncbi:MAG: RelA/SpoT family protein, partial [Thiotrichaceae bacterium]